MTAKTRKLGLAIAAAFAFTSLTAGAQMYKWTDEAGSVTYSNTAPSEPAQVKDVTRIDDINTVPVDQRPKKPAPAGAAATGPDLPAAKPTEATVSPEAPATRPEAARTESVLAGPEPGVVRPASSVRPDPGSAPTLRAGEALRREAEATKPELTQRAQNASRAPQPDAVRDPCLTSADPQCYQRNKDKYHPYMGYAPASARSPVTGAVGASTSPAGAGAIGGQVRSASPAEKTLVPAATVGPAIHVRTK